MAYSISCDSKFIKHLPCSTMNNHCRREGKKSLLPSEEDLTYVNNAASFVCVHAWKRASGIIAESIRMLGREM